MNIFKTFEIFLREPLSILKERFIQIVNINASLDVQPNVSVDMVKGKTQITVVNSDKMYNLCKTALYKKKMNEAQKSSPSRPKGQIVIGQLLKRVQ